jgi:hypothetical protein
MAAEVISRLGVLSDVGSCEAKNFDVGASVMLAALAVTKNKAPTKASTFMV